MKQRTFLVVLDSFGIGALPDADQFGDTGSDTLGAVRKSSKLHIPNLIKLGLYNIDGVTHTSASDQPAACYGRACEKSAGKDTTTGHWEIAGLITRTPMPTYPGGFPQSLIDCLERATGRKIICNKPYSGTQVIRDFGREHMETGALIVYTSADSVLQIAAHEAIIPVRTLYQYCETARKLADVGRIIARPFTGAYPDFIRTENRHDFSLAPPADTMLDVLQKAGYDTIAVGKIHDIFAGKGISEFVRTQNNTEGMKRLAEYAEKDFNGICFVNLVDFDMKYGHRNDVNGYANALSEFDRALGLFLEKMNERDILIITADHGCDPSTASTDHSREYIPVLVYGKTLKHGRNLGTLQTFSDIGQTVLDLFKAPNQTAGTSFLNKIMEE